MTPSGKAPARSAGLDVRLPVDRVTARSVGCPDCGAQPFDACRIVLGITAAGLNTVADIRRLAEDPRTKWRLVLGPPMKTFHTWRRERARDLRQGGGVSK